MTEETQQDRGAGIPGDGQQSSQFEIAGEGQQRAAGEIVDAVPPSPADAPKSFAVGQILVYGIGAAVLGISAGIVFANFALRQVVHRGTYDLGSAAFVADGLKGHLVLNWQKQLAYRLVVEPSDPARQAEFSLAVSTPPRPMTVLFQLKDPAGYVVCFRSIVLKYDPSQAAAIAASGNGSPDQARIDRLEARELERERGQDIFHPDAGPDGQPMSITAQGEIPCSRQAYEHTVSWSFSPDFPTLDEQAVWLKREQDLRAEASASAAHSPVGQGSSAGRPRARKRPLDQPATMFALEGDDELIGFDPAKGIVRTSTGETFFVVKAAAPDNAAKWQDLPATIHFKCNLYAVCALSRRGADVLYARLKR